MSFKILEEGNQYDTVKFIITKNRMGEC
jgi:hypothetical protein